MKCLQCQFHLAIIRRLEKKIKDLEEVLRFEEKERTNVVERR